MSVKKKLTKPRKTSKSKEVKKLLKQVVKEIDKGEEEGKVNWKKVVEILVRIIDLILSFWP